MEILALYTSPDSLETALAAGARHLAATIGGLALVYRVDAAADEPDGWAGFTCAQDAQTAGGRLREFRKRVENSDQPLRSEPPTDPPRIWERAAGGLYGFPLRHMGTTRGVAMVGCPGTWPRIRNAETESILHQLTLVLDHHSMAESSMNDPETADDLLQLSEQLFAQDVERIKQDEKIQRLETLQNDLVERMTRELRAPLNNMIERIIAALASEHQNLSEAGRIALRTSLDEGNSLLRVLQNIVNLWRLKQNQLRVELQDVNVAEVVEEAIFNVRDSLQPEVVLEKRLTSPLSKIRTDLDKLNQILFHCLDNAVKFTRKGRIELSVAIESGRLCCAVTDTGVGIAPEDQSQLFEEFFQVDSSPGRHLRGAGLGLTLVKGLIELLGGDLEFASELGRGSRVGFSLPVAKV